MTSTAPPESAVSDVAHDLIRSGRSRIAPARGKPPLVRLTVGLCLTIVAIAFESVAVATAMPVAARALNGLSYYGWSFSLFLIGMLFSTVLAGRLSDRIGPSKPLLIGLVVFVVGLLVAGSAQQMAQLVAGRLVQGLGSGLINTAVFVCVAKAYSETQRPKVLSYISAAWVLPAFVGPPMAAWVTRQLSWHWVFVAVVPVVIGGGLMVLPNLRSLAPDDKLSAAEPVGARPAPLWAAAVVALSAAALQVAGQRLDWVALALLVGAMVALVVALPPLMPGCFARFQRGLPAVIASRGLLAGAFVGAEAFVPLMLVEEKHIPLMFAGGALTMGSIGWMTGTWLQAQSWLRSSRDRLVTLGCLSLALGVGIVGLVAFVPSLSFVLVAVGWIFAGFGMGLATSSTAIALMSLSRVTEQGRNASSLNLADALGSALFVGLTGTLFTTLTKGASLPLTFGTPLVAMSVVALMAAAASKRIGRLGDRPDSH